MTPTHPKGTRARVLLSSVFGPYARDDAYGSRAINPMELYQNQVTRFQGPFSLRMFHRSFGLMLIQENLQAPCTLLDFPTRQRFVEELQAEPYDIIGISAIMPNIGKVVDMCALIREHAPQATIVVGGHIAGRTDLPDRIDADHVVLGDGVAWFRRFLGQAADRPVRHPLACSAHGTRIMGVAPPERPGRTAAILIPSVGCPVGCNFCSTSALFGGKGRSVTFFSTGEALFDEMCRIEAGLKVQSFFVLDENFLLNRARALRLLELMETHGKSWALYLFSSARVLTSYTIDQLVAMGVSWVWMGIEGRLSHYPKLKNVDTMALVKSLQGHGIRVLGSSIIGLEDHRPADMPRIIAEAVGHQTDFHQFMLYTPNPGTPLYAAQKAAGTLRPESEFSPADAHGQYRFNYRHAHIPAGDEERFLQQAFEHDFVANGPSLARLIATQLTGWKRYRHHPDPRIRRRFRRENRHAGAVHAGAVWAMRRYGRRHGLWADRLDGLLRALHGVHGWPSRLAAPLVGRYFWRCLEKEERRLASGWRYEPATFYEKNAAARRLALTAGATSPQGKTTPLPVPAAISGSARVADTLR